MASRELAPELTDSPSNGEGGTELMSSDSASATQLSSDVGFGNSASAETLDAEEASLFLPSCGVQVSAMTAAGTDPRGRSDFRRVLMWLHPLQAFFFLGGSALRGVTTTGSLERVVAVSEKDAKDTPSLSLALPTTSYVASDNREASKPMAAAQSCKGSMPSPGAAPLPRPTRANAAVSGSSRAQELGEENQRNGLLGLSLWASLLRLARRF
mmetsp:Transcript_50943/g.143160  ORF Transcript_50943/g.143160 Transcript_50943/m.143160 type:complete len:212 (+) Transcript_50943:289-924(+)